MTDTQDTTQEVKEVLEEVIADDPSDSEAFPEVFGGEEKTDKPEVSEELEASVEGEQAEEERSYDSYDAKLDDLVKQNTQVPKRNVATGLDIDLSDLDMDTGDEITNEINKAVKAVIQAKVLPKVNDKIMNLESRLHSSEEMASKLQQQEVKEVDDKFRQILVGQGHKPDAYMERLFKYVDHLPKEQVDMVFANAKGVKSALIFQTMFEADMGNYQKLSAEDVSRARTQGERAATERLRANPSSGSSGKANSVKPKGYFDYSDSEWEKEKHKISDKEAFGF